MTQKRLSRSRFIPRTTILNPKNDDIQDLAFTNYVKIGDVVDYIDVDANGNETLITDNVTVLAVNPGVGVILSAVIDSTSAAGTPMLRTQSLQTGQLAIERALKRTFDSSSVGFTLRQNILAQKLNTPSAGKTTYEVADASFWRAADLLDVIADEGLPASDAIVESVNVNADATNNRATVVISSLVDISALTNPFILNKTITIEKAVLRNQERIDESDRPIENEDMETINGIPDGSHVAYETANLFVQNSSKPDVGASRQKLGVVGTRAFLVQGTYPANADALKFTSVIPDVEGEQTDVEVVSAAGLAVTVTGSHKNGYSIQVNNNSGVATAQEIADAINGDADAKRIVQVQYGGDGTGVVVAFGPTNLAGSTEGTRDYYEMEQVLNNKIVGTGFKFVVFRIKPNEQNRMDKPPQDDEEPYIDYRRATENIDR